jgi:putative DNA primase/helicase
MLPAMELDGSSEPHREQAIRDTWIEDGRQRFGWPRLGQLLDPRDVKALQAAASGLYPDRVAGGEEVEEGPALNDASNAAALIEQHGEDLRHVEGLGWLRWGGATWSPDAGPWAELEAIAARHHTAGKAMGGPAGRLLSEWGRQSGNAGKIKGALEIAAHNAAIKLGADDLDADPWLLNCTNGTIDLRTGELREHRREDLITKTTGIAYDPAAEAPRFAQFLTECMGGDMDLVTYLLRWMGYACTGSVEEHTLAIWHGPSGHNGKSTLIRLLLDVLGTYAGTIAPEVLLQGQGQHPTGLMDLRGKRLVLSNEAPEARRWNEALVKQLTGGDAIKARAMRQDFIEFTPTHKLVLATNVRPVVREAGDPFWRRVQLVPWAVSFKDRSDPELNTKLRAEAPGVLRYLVAGCLAWQEAGKQTRPAPAMVTAQTDYRESQDTIGAFVRDCMIEGSRDKPAARTQVYSSYRAWAMQGNEHVFAARVFYRMLDERGWVCAGGGFSGWTLRAGF